MDKLIENKVCELFFKWEAYLKSFSCERHDWISFTQRNSDKLSQIIAKVLMHEYSEHKTTYKIIHPVDLLVPDPKICEHLCHPHDVVIKIIGIHEKEKKEKKDIYLSKTAFGSVVTKTNENMEVIKFRNSQYTDAIIDMIESFDCHNSMEKWMNFLRDLDEIQNSVSIYEIITRV